MTVLVGLNGLADWSAAQPFINVLKCGRPWQGRSPTQHTSHSEAAMRSGGHLDVDGNPIRIPPGADRVGTIILTEINDADTTLNGRYRLTWTGQGTLHLHGVSNIQRGNGFAEFDYRATGTNLVAIELTQIDAANPLKLVACVRTDHIARYAAGEIFRPAWLDQVRGFPLFRFMDWQATNNSTQRVWADRMRASSYSYVPGAPVEVMVALCNLVGAAPWFCYPHLATDDYITRFAQYVRTNLRADLTAHYEFSNEVWNWQFEQAQWANRQGQALWPGQGDAWVQYYAGRSTEMADLLDAVYAGTTGRYRKVLSTQTGYRGLETGILNAPQWVAGRAGRRAPKDAHDCYAITGYFDTGKHGQEGSVEIQQWRQLGETAAFQRMADACDASITRLIETWRYHKRAADAAGLDLVMYEGGSHIVPDHGVLNQNPGLLEFIEKFHYSAHMGRLYTRAISAFQLAGGEAFNVFVEMARSGRHGFWGGLRHASDRNPRWDAVKAALEGPAVTPANPSPVEPTPVPTPTPTPEPAPMPTPSPRRAPSTASMLHCLNGHSLTDVIVNSGLEGWPGNLPNLFISQFGEPAWNYPDTFAKDTIPGSPLRVRWNDNSTGRTGIAKFDTLVTTETVPPAKVTAKSNEAPMKDTLDYLVRFAENTIARGKSRKEVIMWAGWPHKDGSPAFGNFRQAAVEYGRSFRFFSEYATWKVRRKNPNLPADWRVWTFNANAWWIRFFDDVQARAVPGITDHRVLFSDDIHLTPVGEYAISVFFYTCLYQKDARTLSYKPRPAALPAALDEYFKRIAFEVASAEASIGMGGTANAEPTFNPATHGDPLDPSYVHGNAPAPTPPVVTPPVVVPPVVVDPPVEPEPEQPEPEEPNMADRDKLKELLAILKTTTADLENYLTGTPVVVDPPVVTPPPVAGRPIWETAKVPVISAPASVEAPSGQNVVWVPVTLDHTDMQTVLLRVTRAQNANPATINVGGNQAAYLPKDVYRWSPGDDLTHYVRLQLPGSSYRDGQQVIYQMSVVGANKGSITVRVTFRNGAQHPDMPAQRHRAAYKLDLSTAQRANVFNPATLKHSDSGFDAQGNPCWRSRLSHGYSQQGNGETGLYMNEERFPGMADRPVTYDAAENAIRLHTKAAPDNAPYMHERVAYKHQAAMIQGQTLDEVCGNAGVWRMVAKSATRQYSWPAFWLVGRGSQGANGGYTQWPPEIDIMEQFNGSWGAAYTEFTTSCGQHYGRAGSNERAGSKGYVIETDRYLGETEPNTAMHSYACAVQWSGNDAWVTFFFDDEEIATQVLLARHQDMQTRLTLYPMANVAVRALGGNADSYNNNARTGDMLVRDIGYYPSGYNLV